MARREENLELLVQKYGKLEKAGEGSLRAAYEFGAVIDALYGIYTLTQLAAEVGVSNATISKYRKLFAAYPSGIGTLLRRARELSTYDVGILATGHSAAAARYELHCTVCGSYAIEKERVTVETAVTAMTSRLALSQ